MSDDTSRIDAPEQRQTKPVSSGTAAEKLPAAGPHSKPSLTDNERTPGAGTLPDLNEDDVGDAASS